MTIQQNTLKYIQANKILLPKLITKITTVYNAYGKGIGPAHFFTKEYPSIKYHNPQIECDRIKIKNSGVKPFVVIQTADGNQRKLTLTEKDQPGIITQKVRSLANGMQEKADQRYVRLFQQEKRIKEAAQAE